MHWFNCNLNQLQTSRTFHRLTSHLTSPASPSPSFFPSQKNWKVQPHLQTQTFPMNDMNVQTCARDVLPNCREGSPYVFQLRKPLVFEPVELSNHVLYCNQQNWCCWRNRLWHQRRDVPCKVWVEMEVELGLDDKMLKIRKKSALESDVPLR